MNKTKASDKFIVICTPGTLCQGYSSPMIKTFDDYGHAYEQAQKSLLSLCAQGYMISANEEDIKHDGKDRRTQWFLTLGEDEGYFVQILRIEPIPCEDGAFRLPKYLAYDQIYNSHDWLFDYVSCRCHVSTIALNSRGFDNDFMRFKELTAELYEHVFIELDDMDDGKQRYVTLDDDDVCIHYYKIQYNEA